MSEWSFLRAKTHLVNGEIWADVACDSAHVPCAVNGPLLDVGKWLEEHLRNFHTPRS